MKNRTQRTSATVPGFTLIELLVVISIIGVLASMLLPVIGKAKVKGQVAKAQTEIKDLEGAITSYYSTYSRFPASKETRSALTPENPDFTYGTRYGNGWWPNKSGVALQVETSGLAAREQKNNSELVAILKDLPSFRNGTATANVGHSLNPQKTVFLNAKDVDGPRAPGVGADGLYRDPWGNPYIITLDLNYDNQCRDGFYRLDSVSLDPSVAGGNKGFNGHFRPKAGANNFEYRGQVLVWSAGPDGRIDPAAKANAGANKDNVLSWK